MGISPWEDGFPAGETDFPARETDFPAGETDFPTGENVFPAGDNGFPAGGNGFPAGESGVSRGGTGLSIGLRRCVGRWRGDLPGECAWFPGEQHLQSCRWAAATEVMVMSLCFSDEPVFLRLRQG